MTFDTRSPLALDAIVMPNAIFLCCTQKMRKRKIDICMCGPNCLVVPVHACFKLVYEAVGLFILLLWATFW